MTKLQPQLPAPSKAVIYLTEFVYFAVDRAASKINDVNQYDFEVRATELFTNVTTDDTITDINGASTGSTVVNSTT